MSSEERNARAHAAMQAVGNILVRHKRFKAAYRHLEECLLSYTGESEPTCMLILGGTGVGKSTLMLSFLADHAATRSETGRYVPVLDATIPMPATMKNMASELLDSLGDQHADRGTLQQRTKRLRTQLKGCGTNLIILDEFQHFIERKTARAIDDVSDWLKNLITNTQIPVVLIGLPYSRQVLDANEQLKRRFSYQLEMQPFGWGSEADQDEFRRLLDVMDAEIAKHIGDRSGLAEMGDRIHAATRGMIAYVVRLLQGAAYHAVRAGNSRLSLLDLARAYAERIHPDRNAPNPFAQGWNGSVLGSAPPPKRLVSAG